MDPHEIRRLGAEHGRWGHEIELAPGIITPGDDSNRMKLPILGGYARATAIENALAAKYQQLDARIEKSAFDPSLPYFLDEGRVVQTITGRK